LNPGGIILNIRQKLVTEHNIKDKNKNTEDEKHVCAPGGWGENL